MLKNKDVLEVNCPIHCFHIIKELNCYSYVRQCYFCNYIEVRDKLKELYERN